MTLELFFTAMLGAYIGTAVSNLMFERERQEKARNIYEIERARKAKPELVKKWSL